MKKNIQPKKDYYTLINTQWPGSHPKIWEKIKSHIGIDELSTLHHFLQEINSNDKDLPWFVWKKAGKRSYIITNNYHSIKVTLRKGFWRKRTNLEAIWEKHFGRHKLDWYHDADWHFVEVKNKKLRFILNTCDVLNVKIKKLLKMGLKIIGRE